MNRLALLAVLPLTLAAAKSDPLAGRTPGPAQRCIDPAFSNSNATIEDGGLIIVRDTPRRWWVARPIGPCPSLQSLNTLIIERWGSQLCRNDRFRVLGPGQVLASAPCRFGDFVPYTRAAK